MLPNAQIDKNSVTELWKMYLYYFSGLVSEIDKSSETNASVVSQCNTRQQRQRKQETQSSVKYYKNAISFGEVVSNPSFSAREFILKGQNCSDEFTTKYLTPPLLKVTISMSISRKKINFQAMIEYEDGLRPVEIATGSKHCGKLREASSNTLICAQGNLWGTHATH